DNYADVTTISTSFDGARVQVGAAGNLTVRNYLAVDVYWPDGVTLVAGSRIRVRDNAATVYDVVSATGSTAWILVTDRVYVNQATATENATEAEVSYLSYNFLSNPRTNIAMAADASETFVMADEAAPSSAVDPLPTYRMTLAFNVTYTASDGNGTGLLDVTLWYRLNGAGGWIAYATQPGAPSGTFAFVAPGDGTYEFTTTARDNAGNKEPGPGANDTWTIVDTTRPGSRVDPLAAYTNTSTFLVTWAPDAGVVDIATFTIQYRRNGGPWTDWLVGTTLTSGTFAADPPSGLYEFRSIATDVAGNVEIPPAVNDSWTFVDVAAPVSSVRALSMYQTSLSFAVTWGPDFDTTDIASYRIDVSDDGGAWAVWIAATTSTSAVYAGVDGHLYAFRSIATDYAGNVEPAPAGNDTYTIVDVTAPQSAVAPLPTYTITATIPLTWGPAGGTTDIATYTLEVSDDGGAWTPVAGYIGTTLTSGSYTPVDGHTYAFRTVATDRAGNVESVAGNDTWTIVDRTAPVSSHALSGTAGTGGWYVGPVTVSLTAADATSGVLSITYRVDGGAFLTYSASFVVSADGSHTVEYYAVDGAGWTEPLRNVVVRVDTTTPATSASLSGTSGTGGWFRSNVIVTLSASDASSGVASTSYRIDGGAWQAYAGPFIVSGDGAHTVDHRSTDTAGLVEVAGSSAVNIDATAPSVTTATPRGSNVNTTPAIVIAFTEPMDPASVETAFSITPDMDGAFTWSADFRTVTFTPDRALDASTTYVVFLDSGARDAAGNALSGAYTFSFTTAAAPAGFGFGDSWWILAVVAAVGAGLFFLMMRRRSVAAASKPAPAPAVAAKRSTEATIDDVFLLYRDGLLIKHETRRLKPDIDTDILSGMLTAVQQFVKDSFRSEEGDLDELTFGQMHILIGRGKWVILAAMIQGDGTDAMMEQVKRCVQDIEDHQWDQLDGWDGDMVIAKILSPYVKKLVRGEYA
ncbi:MAG: OmpL47-type beta-barrel domain-containing protein, partial [Methanobacteriota archaeon]